MTRSDIVAAAYASIARGSKSFAAASLLFDRPTRERAWLLYSWCRACDDMADGQDHGHGMTRVADPAVRLEHLRTLTAAALAGEATGEPAFEALRVVAAETGLPHRFAHDHIAGFALDAAGWAPDSEDDLLRYCYHVAGVVGCMMAVVMGVDPANEEVLDRACDLGIAFQLANIARDVAEDAAVGRCYLPQAWLSEFGIDRENLMAGTNRPALVSIVRRLTDRAAQFEARARAGTTALSLRSAWAVLAAAAIYGAIGREVARRGGGALEKRVSTSGAAKAGFIIKARWQAQRRFALYRHAAADPGWRRPRHEARSACSRTP